MPSPDAASSSLRALLRDIVDYAGFFPPADLSLKDAIHNYAGYLRSEDAWMLGRFVCKTDQLAELDAREDLFAENPPFRFSVLAGRSDDPATFLQELAHDIGLAEQFHARHADTVRVEAMEMRLPRELLTSDTATLDGFLRDVLDEAEDADLATPEFFLEIPLNEHASRHASLVTGAIAQRQDAAFGLKFRCGGSNETDYPSSTRLADAVLTSLRADVPFKATAGLHHPFRHYDEKAGIEIHGFLNLFGGTALAAEHDLSVDEFQQILEDDEPEHFTFDENTLHWQDYSVPETALHRIRRSHALSFGSCSFDEPREDLRVLGLL